jgi:hypothetical protein
VGEVLFSETPPPARLAIELYNGAHKFRGVFMADHGPPESGHVTKRVTRTKLSLPYPIHYQDIIDLANSVLENSSLMFNFNPELHVLLREVKDTAVAASSKVTKNVKTLPKCVIIDNDFLLTQCSEQSLQIIIAAKNTEEVQGSYTGGSHAEDGHVDSGIKRWAAKEVVHWKTHKGIFSKCLAKLYLAENLAESDLLKRLISLGEWAFVQSNTPSAKSVTDIQAAITHFLQNAHRDQMFANELPDGIFVHGVIKDKVETHNLSCSSSSCLVTVEDRIAPDDYYVLTRPHAPGKPNAPGGTKHSVKWLSEKYNQSVFELDMKLAKDTGKGDSRVSAGEWVYLKSVTVKHPKKSKNDNTFVVYPIKRPDAALRLRWGYFTQQDPDPDVASSDDSISVATSATASQKSANPPIFGIEDDANIFTVE